MVDVDRRIPTPGLTPAHVAGLRRLSTRASAAALPSPSRNGLHSFLPLAESISSLLLSSGVPSSPGLSDSELARAEAEFAFSFPPDLRALLSLSLPSAPGFPNWRSLSTLRSSLDLPIAAVSFQISRHSFWPKSWPPRPSDPDRALRLARSALRRSPLLIPLFHRCYLPCRPSLAGNPVFFVDDHQISLCGFDLSDFFHRLLLPSPGLPLRRQRSAPPPLTRRSVGVDAAAAKKPRWIEFWSDAAACDRRRRSSASVSDPERFVEIRIPRVPEWVKEYLDRIGSVLKEGGWGESEVSEMVEVAAAPEFFEGGDGKDAVAVDGQAVLDALLLKTDRCSDSLRRAGWSCEEVWEALGFDFRLDSKHKKRPEVKLPPEIAFKIGKLAEAVSKS